MYDAILGFFEEVVNLGAAVMLPIVIAIICVFFRMKVGQAIRTGLLVGIGFQGLSLVVSLLSTTVSPVVEYYAAMGSGYTTIEIGFAALGAASWTVPYAIVAIPAIFLVNILLVRLKLTRVLNVDIWNFMHFLVPGALVYALSGSALAGFLVTIACSVVTLFLAERQAPGWQERFGLEGTACTTLNFVGLFYPVSLAINKVIDLIPGLNHADISLDRLSSRIGIFADPAVIGLVAGAFLGIITMQPIPQLLTIMMGMSAVLVLIPRMVSIMMEGLTKLGQAASEYMKSKLGDEEGLIIGMDVALGLGDPLCITATAIMVPVSIGIVFLIPNMTFFPSADLGALCYCAPLAVVASRGNVVRTLICMFVLIYVMYFAANVFAPYVTEMLTVTGIDFGGSMVTTGSFTANPASLLICIVDSALKFFGL